MAIGVWIERVKDEEKKDVENRRRYLERRDVRIFNSEWVRSERECRV